MTSGTPLVLVHGNPENSTVWGPLLEVLDRPDAVLLSPPGFGVPLPDDFDVSPVGYEQWLTCQLEGFRQPVDLVGHDWGGAHVVRVAMSRPDLLRSWASDALGNFAPDYTWHPLARTWQRPGEGEALIHQLFGGDLSERLAVADGLGMRGRVAERIAAGLDPTMGRAVLKLVRAAAQPVMSDAGARLESARATAGLAIVTGADDGNGSEAMHRWAAEKAGADVAVLDGVEHWWPVQAPEAGAAVLQSFWSHLPR